MNYVILILQRRSCMQYLE